ncbi:MAG: ATP-binding protein [Tychonema bourrellyi B0820]|uniref:ATP-binding protein n=1 Tax=Tychonema bourrellyi FEM_GT703 TaxID=2040638 RepID=A0A2G4EVL4_9CYAN|nr:ATP-binding protein [Tychonema bourrellyi]MDQ2100232.1 ATP-binding protein [Tychonema bourrellyi B0820]PHX53575.1 ATP-binding protein [Tychonema bourrellyi FEM_GT703]
MNVEDVVEWANNSIFDKTGEHLTPIQEAILTGVWQRQKYPQIAKDFHCSESHVKKEAAKLWENLRKELGKDLNKFNFRSKIEKKYNLPNISHLHDSLLQIDNVICGQFIQNIKNAEARSPFPPDSPQNKSQFPIIDLTDAPELTSFYDRTSELSTLKEWILQAHTRLITIYGLSGIGKSALTLKLIEQTQTEFDYIIWLSLTNTPTLSTLQTELKQFFGRSQQNPLPTIIDYFRASRCLVILDDVHNIFKPSELVSQYLTGYEDYSKFFKQIVTSSHQSCLILLSWEKPREITALEAENRATRTLHLKGLGEEAAEILREKGLADEEKWSDLITLYQGHPSWLNIIAATIWELFDGSVSLFLADGNDVFLGDLEPILESHLERLSDSEKKVCYLLATQAEAVDISQQPADSELSKSEFLQAIQSLSRRGLVEKMQVGVRSNFQIDPVFKAYIQSK